MFRDKSAVSSNTTINDGFQGVTEQQVEEGLLTTHNDRSRQENDGDEDIY
jgi:hypothetical protein